MPALDALPTAAAPPIPGVAAASAEPAATPAGTGFAAALATATPGSGGPPAGAGNATATTPSDAPAGTPAGSPLPGNGNALPAWAVAAGLLPDAAADPATDAEALPGVPEAGANPPGPGHDAGPAAAASPRAHAVLAALLAGEHPPPAHVADESADSDLTPTDDDDLPALAALPHWPDPRLLDVVNTPVPAAALGAMPAWAADLHAAQAEPGLARGTPAQGPAQGSGNGAPGPVAAGVANLPSVVPDPSAAPADPAARTGAPDALPPPAAATADVAARVGSEAPGPRDSASALAALGAATPASAPTAGAGASAAAPAGVFAGAPLVLHDPDAAAHGLAARLTALVREGGGHARLAVAPPLLGPVEVQISTHGGRAEVTLTAAHAATTDALGNAAPQLRDLLGSAGVDLTRLDVRTQAGLSGQGQGQGQAPGDGQRDAPGGAGGSGRGRDDADGAQTMTITVGRRARGAVDEYA